MPDCQLLGRSQMKSTKPKTSYSPQQVTAGRLRACCSQEEEEQGHSPSLATLAGVFPCLPMPPHGMSCSKVTSLCLLALTR